MMSSVTGRSSAGETLFDSEPERVVVPVLIFANSSDTCPQVHQRTRRRLPRRSLRLRGAERSMRRQQPDIDIATRRLRFARPGEGLLTERGAAVQPRRGNRVKCPFCDIRDHTVEPPATVNGSHKLSRVYQSGEAHRSGSRDASRWVRVSTSPRTRRASGRSLLTRLASAGGILT